MPSIKEPWWQRSATGGCALTTNMSKETILRVSITEGKQKDTLDKINRTAGYSQIKEDEQC